ncbi:MAG TPA: VTT domain-containing protein [Candidatus Binataceae bacterium]|nr:VTT domain-containing protein [Candidatus Binataceae bacterium]
MKRIVDTLVAWGPLGIFVIAILDSAGIPMPGGVDVAVVLLAANPKSADKAYVTAAVAVLGSLIGSLILYWIARRGGEAYFERHAQSARGARLKRWFLEYGLLTVFIPALSPIWMPLKIFVVAAGAFEVSPLAFTVVMAAARIPRYFGLAWLGKRLGPQTLPYLRHHGWQIFIFFVALFFVLYLLIKFLDRRSKLRKLLSDSE